MFELWNFNLETLVTVHKQTFWKIKAFFMSSMKNNALGKGLLFLDFLFEQNEVSGPSSFNHTKSLFFCWTLPYLGYSCLLVYSLGSFLLQYHPLSVPGLISSSSCLLYLFRSLSFILITFIFLKFTFIPYPSILSSDFCSIVYSYFLIAKITKPSMHLKQFIFFPVMLDSSLVFLII